MKVGSVTLQRFVDAQDEGGSFDRALDEIGSGRKVSHWIWWVFPQIEGLGRSDRSRFYALASLDEARDYLAHPVLSPRLHRAVRAMIASRSHDASSILGGDAVKFHSSLTLFHHADPTDELFVEALGQFFGGACDEQTHRLTGGDG